MRLVWIVVLGVSALTASGVAAAQESACVTIEDDAARLACYDAANGRAPRAPVATAVMPAPSVVTVTPPVSPQAAPVVADAERRGILGGLLTGGESANPPVTQMALEVARVVRRPGDQYDLVMTNGEIWSPGRRPERVPRAGESVTIVRIGVGNYILAPESGEPFRVRKQN